ncbi:MAG: hypothetical protein ABIX01_15265 [Chitinophagaceae bacterium]
MLRQFFSTVIFFTAFFGILNGAKAQNIDSLVNLHRRADPQEKIYVHFDKNYYNPGETIWFKAYVFEGLDPGETSKSFYAELLDENGNILDRKTAPIIGSGAASSFDIPAAIKKPVVYFRAYTISMLNSDTAFLFLQPVSILLPAIAVKVGAKNVPAATIRFLPEGGDWVAGLSNTMAFAVTGARELPLEASGIIKDNEGNKVAGFATSLNGMGRVTLSPGPGKTYTAVWKDENGRSYTTPLPPVNPRGITLSVKEEGPNKRFTVQRTDDATDAEKTLHMVAIMNQHMVFAATINLTGKAATSASLPTKELPSGILQITVFDKNYKPLAERVSFVNNHDFEFDADAWVPQKSMAKKGLNVVEVQLADSMAANVSISVTDADLNDAETYQDNIISHLLLTADLRGRIVNPYYYFFSTSDSVAYHLDLVMLTHGWRRYNWEEVLAGKLPAKPWKENNYLSLDGNVSGSIAGGFAPGTTLTGIMKTSDSATTIINLNVDRKGKVFTDGMIFYDFAKLYFSFSDKKMQFDKGMLTITNGLRNGYKIATIDTSKNAEALLLDADIIARNIKNNTAEQRLAALRNMKAVELQNVTVTAKAKTPLEKLDEKYASAMFGGNNGRSFDLTSDPAAVSALSVFQYLQGRVAGLQINTSQNPPSLTWRGGSPALYLNEVKTDADQLSNTPVSDIAYVKVFSPGETGVISSSGGGAIVVYTKKGEDIKVDSKGLDYLQLTGYSPVKQFYSPDYASATSLSDGDQRTTLYWNPMIILTKAKKRFKFQFYNSDLTRRFRLVMEGINQEGKLIHVEKIVQ